MEYIPIAHPRGFYVKHFLVSYMLKIGNYVTFFKKKKKKNSLILVLLFLQQFKKKEGEGKSDFAIQILNID